MSLGRWHTSDVSREEGGWEAGPIHCSRAHYSLKSRNDPDPQTGFPCVPGRPQIIVIVPVCLCVKSSQTEVVRATPTKTGKGLLGRNCQRLISAPSCEAD